MHDNVTEPGGTVVPTLRYRDVCAAIDWLCNAFGFDKHHVISGADGAVRYAELTFGNGMVMLAPVEDSGLDTFMAQPSDTGGAETQICYLFVADATAHCARAKAAGAEILLDIENANSNRRGYSCRDLEGHIWNFGTYDPWRPRAAAAAKPSRRPSRGKRAARRLTVAAGLLTIVLASAMLVGWGLGVIDVGDFEFKIGALASVAEDAASPEYDPLARERHAREIAERAVKDVREQLARERSEKAAAERLALGAREQLGVERTAREAAERAARDAHAPLGREQAAREDAGGAIKQPANALARADIERALEEARQQLVRERGELEDARRIAQETRERLSLAERASVAVQEQLAAEHNAREASELAALQTRQQLAKEQGAREAAEHAAKEAREQEAKERAKKSPPPRARQAQSWKPSGKSFVDWWQ